MARVEAERSGVQDDGDGDGESRGQSLSLRRAPVLVTFPDVARRRSQSFPPPLKLENEEGTEDMSPRNVWQVYALGGFMIGRWLWARWRERSNRGTPNED